MGILRVAESYRSESRDRVLPKKPKKTIQEKASSGELISNNNSAHLNVNQGSLENPPEPVYNENSTDYVWNLELDVNNSIIEQSQGVIVAENPTVDVQPTSQAAVVVVQEDQMIEANPTSINYQNDYVLNNSMSQPWEDAFMNAVNPPSNPPEPCFQEETTEMVWGDFNEEAQNDVTMKDNEQRETATVENDNNNITDKIPDSLTFEETWGSLPDPPAAQIPHNSYDDFDEIWNLVCASPSVVEGIKNEGGPSDNHEEKPKVDPGLETLDVDTLYNMDLVKYAMGESGLDGFLPEQEQKIEETPSAEEVPAKLPAKDEVDFHNYAAKEPVGTSQNFIVSEAAILSPRNNGVVKKRKAGRPARTTPLAITEVPKHATEYMSEQALMSLKHQRARELNNEASRRCRFNKKQKEIKKEEMVKELQEKNNQLKEQVEAKEKEVDEWKKKCRSVGILC